MKRFTAMALTCVLIWLLAACGSSMPGGGMQGGKEEGGTTEKAEETDQSVELTVATTFAGNDGNAKNYRDSYKKWEMETGNTVIDMSVASDPSFKARVAADFETNSEPDVLFFFHGVDANSFIEAGKVVSIDEIRTKYPDYAGNMLEDDLPPSTVDGKSYIVPVNGYWEALFVNRSILDEAGVAVPGMDYTWEQFLEDCEKIKQAGYIPIAASLGHIPHYWWEYAIYNHTGPNNHLTIPESVDTEIGQAWVAGMNDIKALYEAGYFPVNTLSATDDETFTMFLGGKAAFLLDGSWKVNGIVTACQSDPGDPETLDTERLSKFDVVYVPGTQDRKANDLIGGISMGYYITRKAWDDPAKRAAAVSFVSYMTCDEVVVLFSQFTTSAIKDIDNVDTAAFNELQLKAADMLAGCNVLLEAVQDIFDGECRVPTFAGMPEIVTGSVDAEDAVAEGLRIYNE